MHFKWCMLVSCAAGSWIVAESYPENPNGVISEPRRLAAMEAVVSHTGGLDLMGAAARIASSDDYIQVFEYLQAFYQKVVIPEWVLNELLQLENRNTGGVSAEVLRDFWSSCLLASNVSLSAILRWYNLVIRSPAAQLPFRYLAGDELAQLGISEDGLYVIPSDSHVSDHASSEVQLLKCLIRERAVDEYQMEPVLEEEPTRISKRRFEEVEYEDVEIEEEEEEDNDQKRMRSANASSFQPALMSLPPYVYRYPHSWNSGADSAERLVVESGMRRGVTLQEVLDGLDGLRDTANWSSQQSQSADEYSRYILGRIKVPLAAFVRIAEIQDVKFQGDRHLAMQELIEEIGDCYPAPSWLNTYFYSESPSITSVWDLVRPMVVTDVDGEPVVLPSGKLLNQWIHREKNLVVLRYAYRESAYLRYTGGPIIRAPHAQMRFQIVRRPGAMLLYWIKKKIGEISVHDVTEWESLLGTAGSATDWVRSIVDSVLIPIEYVHIMLAINQEVYNAAEFQTILASRIEQWQSFNDHPLPAVALSVLANWYFVVTYIFTGASVESVQMSGEFLPDGRYAPHPLIQGVLVKLILDEWAADK